MSRFTPINVLPNGHMMPYLSARYRQQLIDAAYEHAGGFPRMMAWVEKSDENYEKFLLGVWAKGAAKPLAVEAATASVGVEDLLKQLEDKMIDVTPKEPTDG